jgi:nucleoside-diphosphate-sugar epimerase
VDRRDGDDFDFYGVGHYQPRVLGMSAPLVRIAAITQQDFIMTNKRAIRKIVVIDGSGLIGSKLVDKLREHGHEAVAASPNLGVNTLTGVGLAEVLKGASVVVDVSNSPSFEDNTAMEFFTASTRDLLAYEAAAGVRHHVALSVVGIGAGAAPS